MTSLRPRLSYSEKLSSPQWLKKRLQILERDNFRCVVCGNDKDPLSVWHATHEANTDPWDYPDDHYQTLCEGCFRFRRNATEHLCNILRLSVRSLRNEQFHAAQQKLASLLKGGLA